MYFWAIVGPFVGNFVLWALFTIIPMPAVLLGILAVGTGCLMLWGIVHFLNLADKRRSTDGQP